MHLPVLTTLDYPSGEPKPHLAQLEAISSRPTSYFREEIDPHLATTSFQRLVQFGWGIQRQTERQINTFGVLQISLQCPTTHRCNVTPVFPYPCHIKDSKLLRGILGSTWNSALDTQVVSVFGQSPLDLS